MDEPSSRTRRIWPAWVVGMVIAVVIFAVILVVANMAGFGDDPAIGAVEQLIGI